MTIDLLPGITALAGAMQRHPGDHNFPDMEIVIDAAQTEIENGQLYLVQVRGRSPVVKKCIERGGSIMLHPALSTHQGVEKPIKLFGREIPCVGIEFSDSFAKGNVTVHGRLVGIWAGAPA